VNPQREPHYLEIGVSERFWTLHFFSAQRSV